MQCIELSVIDHVLQLSYILANSETTVSLTAYAAIMISLRNTNKFDKSWMVLPRKTKLYKVILAEYNVFQSITIFTYRVAQKVRRRSIPVRVLAQFLLMWKSGVWGSEIPWESSGLWDRSQKQEMDEIRFGILFVYILKTFHREASTQTSLHYQHILFVMMTSVC